MDLGDDQINLKPSEERDNEEKKQALYFKAKRFTFHNVYQSFDRKHNCLRLIDFDFLAMDECVMKDLDII